MFQNLEKKLAFNKGRGTQFSAGYITGVKQYRKFPKKDRKQKQAHIKAIDYYSGLAKQGDEFAKGFMCGIRDGANERKSKSF